MQNNIKISIIWASRFAVCGSRKGCPYSLASGYPLHHALCAWFRYYPSRVAHLRCAEMFNLVAIVSKIENFRLKKLKSIVGNKKIIIKIAKSIDGTTNVAVKIASVSDGIANVAIKIAKIIDGITNVEDGHKKITHGSNKFILGNTKSIDLFIFHFIFKHFNFIFDEYVSIFCERDSSGCRPKGGSTKPRSGEGISKANRE